MYDWKRWYDEVVEDPAGYLIDGAAHTITGNHGETIQEGTPQNEDNFNRMENGILDAHIAAVLFGVFARQQAWVIERGTITLTNTQQFPFNDSEATVALSEEREITDYSVLSEVSEYVGNVGEIVVRDKLTNGFKIAYTGSASSVTINYIVIGGYMR